MMRKKWRTRTSALLLGVICSISAFSPEKVCAEEYWPEGPSIVSPNAIVMEVNTGTVLYEKDSHEERYPASITKIMTSMLAVENCDMEEIVTFSKEAVYKNEANDMTHIARDVGEQMTMEQCLYAVMLGSANECAYAVAEHVGDKFGGGYEAFIEKMNERAAELGCLNTQFNNSNGLPDPEHWTSAYDMALISAEAYRNEAFRTITGTKTYTIPFTNKHPDEETYIPNHHCMLNNYKTRDYLYEYCTGGKTGYTDAAKHTLVTYAEKDGLTLVCVVMYTDKVSQWADTKTLLDYCFDEFRALNISENEESIAMSSEKDIGLLNTNRPFVTLDTNAYIVLPKDASFADATFLLETGQSKETIARLAYTYFGKTVGSAEIVNSGAAVEPSVFYEPQEDELATEQEEDVRVVKIKPKYIVFVILLILVLIGVIYLVVKYIEDFYVIRHDRRVRRDQRNRFRQIRRRKGHSRRRKDRMFR